MDNTGKEILRHLVLEILATRHPAALTVEGITRRARMETDGPIQAADVEAALELLRGLQHVRFEVDHLGSTKYWTATAEGVLQHERHGAH